MSSGFLLYCSNGFVGEAIARLAVQNGLRPILAGRNASAIEALATEMDLEWRSFNLDQSAALDAALREVDVVLHCAGPYLYTSKPMVEGCLRTGTHYLDLTGEIPVYEALAARDEEAKAQGVMIMPAVGFDVVPTDCLAAHLKRRLPSATRLTLAFHSKGPAGLPPGTANTTVEMIPYGTKVRRNGELVPAPKGEKTRSIDFGSGEVKATLMSWGDIFTAYHSTGIPNIEDYVVIPDALAQHMKTLGSLRPLFRLSILRSLLKRMMPSGSTAEQRERTRTHVWGEVEDDQGQKAASRLHGPEAGVVWTERTALAVVQKVLAGFQTPAQVYGADFAQECEGVTREDII